MLVKVTSVLIIAESARGEALTQILLSAGQGAWHARDIDGAQEILGSFDPDVILVSAVTWHDRFNALPAAFRSRPNLAQVPLLFLCDSDLNIPSATTFDMVLHHGIQPSVLPSLIERLARRKRTKSSRTNVNLNAVRLPKEWVANGGN